MVKKIKETNPKEDKRDKEIEFWQKKADEQLHKNRDKDKEIWKLKNKIKKLGKDIDKLTLGG